MIRAWYESIAGSVSAMAGTVIFLGIFLLVLAYVLFAMRDRKAVADVAALPLADDTTGRTSGGDRS